MIKNIYFLILLFMSIFVNPAMGQSKEEKQVAEAVEILRLAMISGDSVALSNIAHDALSYGHSGGHVEGKAEFVHKLASKQSNFIKIEFSDQTIHVVGNTAIVRHKLVAETHDAGKDVSAVKIAILYVFKKEKDHWQMLARQAVKI